MGPYLKEPVTEKISKDEHSDRLSYGASSMQGWRVSQEDAHNCIIDFDDNTSFFAVYDGHSGAAIAKYCSKYLPDFLRSMLEYKKGNLSQALEDCFMEFDDTLTKPKVIREMKRMVGLSLSDNWNFAPVKENKMDAPPVNREVDIKENKKNSKFTKTEQKQARLISGDSSQEKSETKPKGSNTKDSVCSSDDDDVPDSDDDDDSKNESENKDEETCDSHYKNNNDEERVLDGGCTAVVALLKGDQLYVANAGDSRCVLSRKGVAVNMSFDHKPGNKLEKDRIHKAGGEIFWFGGNEWRINGLNLSRALGDHRHKRNTQLPPKEQMVTALPDIQTLTINLQEDEFMILACDGIWNSMSSQEVVDFVNESLKKDQKLSTICEEMFTHCLASDTNDDEKGCDNMTAIIITFHDLKVQNSKQQLESSDISQEDSEAKKPKIKKEEKKEKRIKVK